MGLKPMRTNEQFIASIEAIAGLPMQTTNRALLKIASDLKPLLSDLNKHVERAEPEWQQFGAFEEIVKKKDLIRAAAHFMPEETFKLSKLITTQPPENIHRMQKSDPYWTGDFFSSNMIVHAMNHCNLNKNDLSILDLGSSSGSMVRVLAAYNHSWKMFGCDPIKSAIDWAKEHVTTGTFEEMENDPPLPFSDSSMDGVTAISVWSHHRPDAAQVWIDEVARILKPGGFFAVTFSTLHHVRWLAKNNRFPPEQIEKMLRAFAERGNFFVPINYAGEDNETDDNWGQSSYSRERFFSMFHEKFDIAGYFPGLNQGNQDLAVCVKR